MILLVNLCSVEAYICTIWHMHHKITVNHAWKEELFASVTVEQHLRQLLQAGQVAPVCLCAL